jgi:hypothetical protein
VVWSHRSFNNGGDVKRDKSRYAQAREPYRQLHPQAKMHHMVPSSRRREDSEFNLFPWNEKSHAAWHLLFTIMTTREVWQVLPDVHMLVFQTTEPEMVREWCLPYRYTGKKSEQKDILTPQGTEKLQQAWAVCFGGTDLRAAQRLLRYMMLYMVLGRYADHTPAVYENRVLTGLLQSIEGDLDRAWAFRQCFGRIHNRATVRSVKKIIRSVRARSRTIPIR